MIRDLVQEQGHVEESIHLMLIIISGQIVRCSANSETDLLVVLGLGTAHRDRAAMSFMPCLGPQAPIYLVQLGNTAVR